MNVPKRLLLCGLLLFMGLARAGVAGPPASPHSCSSFLLRKAGAVYVGHNLDESIPVPGLMLVNPRGQAKESLSYQDMLASAERLPDLPRVSWVSRYGSIVYTTCGREFIDGGMNEAGFYVGEMTLLGSKYPEDPARVKIYHHAWMQYLLDNFATVEEALASLAKVVPDGHCQWHFFLADRSGRAALVEFAKGSIRIHTGADLPHALATNFTYASCMEELATYEGFGGKLKVDFTYDPKSRNDIRHVWAAAMLRRFEADPAGNPVDQAFEILKQMWMSGNRWSLVFDPQAMRVHWNTHLSRTRRHVDFKAFDLGPSGRPMALDIHRELSGDASAAFQPLTPELNQAAIRRFWEGVDAGFMGNRFWKPKIVRKMQAYHLRCVKTE